MYPVPTMLLASLAVPLTSFVPSDDDATDAQGGAWSLVRSTGRPGVHGHVEGVAVSEELRAVS